MLVVDLQFFGFWPQKKFLAPAESLDGKVMESVKDFRVFALR